MKKLFALALMSWLCTNTFAQTNPAPAPGAAPASTAPAPAASPTNSGVVGGNNAVYVDRIPPEQMLTLDASGDKFQARHIADLSGKPRGAAIILHDSGQHPSWPFTAAALIDDLPLHGWDTLNIELPTPAAEMNKPDTATPAPTNPAAPSASGAATTPNTPTPSTTASTANAAPLTTLGIEPQTQARISAAIKYFADQKQNNIVLIGFGSGAIRTAENLRLLTATGTLNNTAPLTALVMIAPQQQLNGIEMDLPRLLPLTGIATLDMTLDSEPQARADAEARRRAVMHQRARIYTRLEIPPINTASDAQHSTMVKRVRSWLQVNAHAPQKPTETKQPTAAPPA